MSRLLVVLVLCLCLTSTTQAQGPPSRWLDISMGGPLVDWFNATAAPQDIARIENTAAIDPLLPFIRAGRKMVVFKSIPEAELLLPQIADQIDIVGYNLERGPLNDADEQAAPVESVVRMRQLADEYGLLLAVGPDHDFTVSHGAEMAPYADIFVLQIQRQQTNPTVVQEFVSSSGAALLAANPDLQISVQIRAEGEPEQLVALISSLEPAPAGVSVLTSPESVQAAQRLAAVLRRLPPPTAPMSEAAATVESAPQDVASVAPALAFLAGASMVSLLMLGILGVLLWMWSRRR